MGLRVRFQTSFGSGRFRKMKRLYLTLDVYRRLNGVAFFLTAVDKNSTN